MFTNVHAKVRRSERELVSYQIGLVTRTKGYCGFGRDDNAMTVDVSFHGMRVRTALALNPGDWVGVVRQGGFPHAIPARVAWVREDRSTYWVLAGIEFESAEPA